MRSNATFKQLSSALVLAITALLAAPMPTAGAVGSGSDALARGAAKPPPGTGINTAAARSSPGCDADAGPYGRYDFVLKGSGPVCVVRFRVGADNGGATAPGVTKDAIRVVVITPNDAQYQQAKSLGVATARNRATSDSGTMRDAFVDTLAAFAHVYETWGRKIEFSFVESTGSDESAQRADAVAVKSIKPFAMIDAVASGLDTLDSVIAGSKVFVTGYSGSTEAALKQAPYRWGTSDSQAVAINTAQFIGAQLTDEKAEYAGDEALQRRPRKYAAIYPNGKIDIDGFKSELAKSGEKIVGAFPYESNGSVLGDSQAAQDAAPTIVQKIKALDVTSVILFTDYSTTKAVLEQATKQELHPEWMITGYQYQDLTLLARAYDQTQWAHAFGISNLYPGVVGSAGALDSVSWYWGPTSGTYSIEVQSWMTWLLSGVHAAGPNLTAKTFRQGLFATPAFSGAADDDPLSIQTAWGKTAGLPYDEYMALGTDFAPVWYDATTEGYSQLASSASTPTKGVEWYLDDGKRYQASQWPKKAFSFFDKSGAVVNLAQPAKPTVPNPCTGCPSDGGPGTPSAAA